MLRRMGELGMQILERVAQEGRDAAKTQADPAARCPDSILAYARICRCLRDTMALEARIVAGKLPAAPRAAPENAPRADRESAPRAEREGAPRAERESARDPRRPLIKNFLCELIETSPIPKSVKAGFRQQLDPLITEGLENDPEQDQPAGAIVLDICKELGLRCSASQMPDELLTRLHRLITPAEKAAVANEVYRRIRGHDPP